MENSIFLIIKRGSDLWEKAVKEKKINDNEFVVYADSNRDLSRFSKEDLFEYCEKAYKKFYLRPWHIFNKLVNDIRKNNFTLEGGIHGLLYLIGHPDVGIGVDYIPDQWKRLIREEDKLFVIDEKRNDDSDYNGV